MIYKLIERFFLSCMRVTSINFQVANNKLIAHIANKNLPICLGIGLSP